VSSERLARELRDSFKNRALLYWSIYDELRREIGADKAASILGRAIERRGRDAGAALFRDLAPKTPTAVAERFISTSPDGGRLFPTEVARDPDGTVHIEVTSCPLKQAWEEAKLPAGDIAAMCRIAGKFDTGMFDLPGLRFSAETWQAGRTGCCRLHLAPAK
jgi:hypothetical protein